MKHRNKSISWFGAGFSCEGFLAFWFGKTTINSFWRKARFLFEVLWSSIQSYAPFSLLHSNEGVMDWELWAAVQLFLHKSFIWMKGELWLQKSQQRMASEIRQTDGCYCNSCKRPIWANWDKGSFIPLQLYCIVLFLNGLGTWWSNGNLIPIVKW